MAGCCKIEPEEQLFIFGRYFGECIGDCCTFYKLTDHTLLPDVEDYFNNKKINFSHHPLPEIKENLARDLFKDFPTSLFNIKEPVIGCPDCADQGGYYLEIPVTLFHFLFAVNLEYKGTDPNFIQQNILCGWFDINW